MLLGLLNYAVANEDLDRNRLITLDVPSGVKREPGSRGVGTASHLSRGGASDPTGDGARPY